MTQLANLKLIAKGPTALQHHQALPCFCNGEVLNSVLVEAVIYGYSHPGFLDAGGEGAREMAWEWPWGNKLQFHKPTAQSKEQGSSFRSGWSVAVTQTQH